MRDAHAKGRTLMSRADGADRPEDVDAAFAEIVSELRAQGVGQTDPEELEAEESPDSYAGTERAEDQPSDPDNPWRGNDTEWAVVMFAAPPAVTGECEQLVHTYPSLNPRPTRSDHNVTL